MGREHGMPVMRTRTLGIAAFAVGAAAVVGVTMAQGRPSDGARRSTSATGRIGAPATATATHQAAGHERVASDRPGSDRGHATTGRVLAGAPGRALAEMPGQRARDTGSSAHASIMPARGVAATRVATAGVTATRAATAGVTATRAATAGVTATRTVTGGAVTTRAATAGGVANRVPKSPFDPSVTSATITIPRLGVRAPVYERGIDATRHLPIAPGYAVTHFWYSGAPGRPGNYVAYGHDDIEGRVFQYLPDMRVGDPVYLDSGAGRYVYRVVGSRIVTPRDVAVMAPTRTATLTLISCYPYNVDSHRIVVTAALDRSQAS